MIIDQLIANGCARAEGQNKIHKIVTGHSFSTMHGNATVFSNLYPLLIFLESGYGFAYNETVVADEEVARVMRMSIGDACKVEGLSRGMKVALCDALYSTIRGERSIKTFSGNVHEKARHRAEVVLAHVPNGATCLLMGSVSDFIEEAQRRDISIIAVDAHEQKVDQTHHGVTIRQTASLEDLMRANEQISYVIATGMTFINGSADEIIETAKRRGLHLTFFLETMGRCGEALLEHGVDRVVAEEYPFYDYAMDTQYSVFEK